jgi:hypothetical protein
MSHARYGKLWLVAWLATCGALPAADTRYYQENGVTYRETRYTVQHPVAETQLAEQQHTVYRQRDDIQLQDSVRKYQIPVTEYRTETYWKNRWNPFAQPYLASRVVPVTRWETRAEAIKIPVARRQLVPEIVATRVPITSTRMVNEDIISRVPVSGPPAASSAPVRVPPTSATTPSTVPMSGVFQQRTAPSSSVPLSSQSAVPQTSTTPVLGGISQLEQDPPRVGSVSPWRPGPR